MFLKNMLLKKWNKIKVLKKMTYSWQIWDMVLTNMKHGLGKHEGLDKQGLDKQGFDKQGLGKHGIDIILISFWKKAYSQS